MLVVMACAQVANVPALQQTGGAWPRCISGCTANDVEINSVWLDVSAGNYTLGETVTHNVSMNLYFHRQNTYCIVVVADLYEGGVLQRADWASSIIGYHGGSGNYIYSMGTVNWTYGKLFEIRNVLVMWAPNEPKGSCSTNCTEYNAPSKCNQPPTFIVTTPLVVDFEFNEVCFCNDTTFTDKTTGGVKPYTWYWDFVDGDSSTAQNTTHHFDTAGTYTVTLNVIDSDSPPTTASQSYNVTVDEKPTADAGSDQSISSCGGAEAIGGSPTGSGGTPPYSYNWTPTTGLDDPTSPNPTASAGGDYTVRVTDANGCWAEDTVVVTVSGAPTADAGDDREVCPGRSVVIGGNPTASGGGSPYTYNWTPATGLNATDIANPTASPNSTTIYSVLVTGGGCQAVDHAHVTVHDTPTCHISASPGDHVCQGTAVTLWEDGGDAVNWSWSTGNDTQSIHVTSSGTYSVTISDSHGCQSSCQISVMVHDGPTANAGVDKEICAGGSVRLSGLASGGTPPYTYDWTGPESHPNTQNTTVNTAGTYTLTVIDDNCCSDTDDVIVSQYPSPTADAGADAGVTAGGSVVIGGSPTASGGTGPYTYGWSPSTGLNATTIANPTASPAVNTTYTVTVTDSKGCTDSDDVIVTVAQGCCICGFVYRAGTTEALAGWGVILERHTNPWVEVGSTITDANGKYCFCGLGDGEYRVSEVIEPYWTQVSPLPNQHLMTLSAGASDPALGPFFNFENEQGPADPLSVGWEVSPVDKLAVLVPWIVLFAVIVAGASLLVLRSRRI